MTTSVPSLVEAFVVLAPGARASLEPVDAGLYARLDAKYGDFVDHQLVALHHFHADWPTWEMHPKGDEVVVLIAGMVDFCLRFPEGEQVVQLAQPGEFVIVPAGVWHTARIADAASLLFVTPGEGTENQPTSEFKAC